MNKALTAPHRLEDETTPKLRWRQAVFALGAVGAYVLLFLLLYPGQGAGMAALSFLPVAVTAWLWGLWAGLLAGLLSIPLNTLLLNIGGYQPGGWDVVLHSGGGAGSLVLLLIGVVVGRMSDLGKQVQQQLAERQRTEEALRQSEQRFRALIEHSADGIALLSAAGVIQYQSPAYTQMLGYTSDERARMGTFDLLHPDDVPRARSLFADLLQSPGLSITAEVISQHKDGSWRWIETTGTNLLAEPSVGAILVNYHDITERKQAEMALRESEQQYQTLFARAQRQAQELTLLDKVRTALARELDLPILLRTVVEAIAQTFGYTQVSLYLLQGEKLMLQHQVGYERVILEIPVTQGISGRVVRTGKPALLENVRADPEFLGAIEGIVSEVCVPLLDQGRVVGTLNVESIGGVRLSDADLQLMIALSEHVSVAIGRARLYSEDQRRNRILAALYETTLGLMNRLELNDLLTAIVTQAAQLLGTTHGYLYLVEPGETEIEVKLGTGIFTQYVGYRLKPGEGLAGKVWQTGQPRAVADYRTWSGRSAQFGQTAFRATVGVPLTSGPQIVGVIGLASLEPGRAFGDDEVELLNRFAQLASIALDNAQLYTLAQKELAERKQAEAALQESEKRYRSLFEDSPIPLSEQDFSLLAPYLDRLRAAGVTDFRAYFEDRPAEVARCATLVKTVDVNKVTLKLYKAKSKEELLAGLSVLFTEESYSVFREELIAMAEGKTRFEAETVNRTLTGDSIHVVLTWFVVPGYEKTLMKVVVSLVDITDRKQAEERLREAEAKYRTLVEQMPAVTYLDALDETASTLYISPQVEAVLGYSPEEWMADPELWPRLLHPDDRGRALAENARHNTTGAPFNLEYRLIARDGRVVWIRDQAVIVRDETGQPRYSQGLMMDITEHTRAEQALREAETKYRTLVEQLPAITYIAALDEAKTRLYVSPQIETLLGFTQAEYLADPDLWRKQLHPDDRERVLAEATRLYEGSETFVSEYRTLARDGHAVWFHDEAVIVKAEARQPRFLQGVKIDITARKQRERELEAIATVSAALRVAQSRAEMLPIILDQLIELLKADGASLAFREPNSDEIAIVLGQGNGAPFTGTRLRVGHGVTGYVVETGQPYLTNDAPHDPRFLWPRLLGDLRAVACIPLLAQGQTSGALWVGRTTPFADDEVRLLIAIADIAANALRRVSVMETLEQRVAERTRELEAANEQLKELDRLKDQFVASVSHELRTPLTNITLYLGMLGKTGAEGLGRYLSVLQRETRRLTHLIEDVLTLSRIGQGGATLALEPRVLDGLIAEVLEAHAASAEAKSLTLTHKPNPDAPVVPIDYAQMMQVFTNLIGNAVAYTPAAGQVTVTTGLRRSGARAGVVVCVHNTGPVIPAEDLLHLFERFYRGRTGWESGEPGTGLGLTICKEIVERHHGQISARSEEDFGTEFEVWLPMRTDARQTET